MRPESPGARGARGAISALPWFAELRRSFPFLVLFFLVCCSSAAVVSHISRVARGHKSAIPISRPERNTYTEQGVYTKKADKAPVSADEILQNHTSRKSHDRVTGVTANDREKSSRVNLAVSGPAS